MSFDVQGDPFQDKFQRACFNVRCIHNPNVRWNFVEEPVGFCEFGTSRTYPFRVALMFLISMPLSSLRRALTNASGLYSLSSTSLVKMGIEYGFRGGFLFGRSWRALLLCLRLVTTSVKGVGSLSSLRGTSIRGLPVFYRTVADVDGQDWGESTVIITDSEDVAEAETDG